MRQFHSGKRRIQRFGHNLVVVDANHRDIFADNQPATGGLGVDGPSAGVVEAEEAVDIRVLVEERGHAGGVLRALNHAAGKRRGGHFVAEESDGAGTAGAQPAGQTVGQVTEFGGDVADSLGDIGADGRYRGC